MELKVCDQQYRLSKRLIVRLLDNVFPEGFVCMKDGALVGPSPMIWDINNVVTLKFYEPNEENKLFFIRFNEPDVMSSKNDHEVTIPEILGFYEGLVCSAVPCISARKEILLHHEAIVFYYDRDAHFFKKNGLEFAAYEKAPD